MAKNNMRIFLLIAAITLLGCVENKQKQPSPEEMQKQVNAAWESTLPPGATDVKELRYSEGDWSAKWVEFNWRGKRWLYGWSGNGDGGPIMLELKDE